MQDRTEKLIDTFASIASLWEFAVAPNGLSVAFVHPVGEHRQIFVMPTDGVGMTKRLTATLNDCFEPHWSPDNQHLVYTRDKALWIVNADGTNARELTEHPAGNANACWSPDGSRIAFLSRRRGWSHLWTIAPAGTGLTQVTRGEFDVADFVWAHNSQSFAYCSTRESDLRTRSVYLVSANGGDEQLVSPNNCWNGAPNFSPDGKTLAFVSDCDGWFHVYLYDLRSRSTRQLTTGECEDGGPHFYEVDPNGGPIFSPDGKSIAFIRHREGKYDVYVVDVEKGDTRRISRNDGHHRIVGWLPDSQHIAVTFDAPTTPSDLWIISIDGHATQITDSSAGDLKSSSMIAPEWVTFVSHDSMTIPAGLLRPAEKTRAPAVVFIHGGPSFAFGEFFYPLPQFLAQEGYVVLLPNYRGSTGYGTAFRQANFGEWGHADALDVIQGARWLQKQDFVDPNRVAVVGPSYGAYLTLCVLTLAPELFCAGVDMYGDSDIADAYRHEDRDARWDLRRHMGTPEENPDGYRRGSPLRFAERIQAPLLILHGKEDMLVVPRMSEKMIEQLKIENKYFESHFYDGETHGFDKPENKKDAWERVIKFLNRHCKGK